MSPETLALLSGRTLERVTVGLTTNCWICGYATRPWPPAIPQIKQPGTHHDWRCDTLIYEWSGGTIPRHHTLMHVCQEPRCVNPDHMRVVRRKYHAGRTAKSYTKEDVDTRIADLRAQSRPAVKRPSETTK